MLAIVDIIFRIICFQDTEIYSNASKIKEREMIPSNTAQQKDTIMHCILCSLEGTNSPTYDNFGAVIRLHDVTTSNPKERLSESEKPMTSNPFKIPI